jgi:Protein of unknown function (DUF763)
MKRIRKQRNAAFKAKVALAAIKGGAPAAKADRTTARHGRTRGSRACRAVPRRTGKTSRRWSHPRSGLGSRRFSSGSWCGSRPSSNLRRLHATLAAAADAGPKDFAELLLTHGVGARTVRSLAMVAEIVHGAPYRFSDPARFSIAHGGKDRHPFPVPIAVYDRTIRVLKSAVAKARLGRAEELAALKRLDDQARLLEGYVTGPALPQVLDQDWRNSHANGGRSIFGWEPPPKRIRSG